MITCAIVAVPWEHARAQLQPVLEHAVRMGWNTTVYTDLVAVPVWVRPYHTPWQDRPENLAVDVLFWLCTAQPHWEAEWTFGMMIVPEGRWLGAPGTWRRGGSCTEKCTGNILCVPSMEDMLATWSTGNARWPPGAHWAGSVLPGRTLPAWLVWKGAWNVYPYWITLET